ncbi:MAG: hypothetical protein WBG65_02370 [Sulfurimonadaceae bacterium]
MLSRIKYKLLALCIVPLLITACGDESGGEVEQTTTPNLTVGAFTVQPFTAKYYIEQDGTTPGVGTDGSDPSIVPVLMHTETVTRPAISYPYAYEFGIDSYNLYAQWEGEIVIHEKTDINASFDVSWSDVSFYIDDNLISKWANSKKIIPLTLDVGSHSVRVEYHNHWSTTGFNVSFTNYRKTDVNEDLSSIINDTTQISYIVAYEVDTSTSKYNEVEITLPPGDRPHLLFLSSYDAINWIIKNPYNRELQGVVFNSYGPGITVSNAGNALILEASDLSIDRADFTQGKADIVSMTGREPDYTFSEYGMSNIELPNM